MAQCLVLISDSGESWALNGDQPNADDSEKNDLLPRLLEQGWTVASVTAGSGSKDDTSYWLAVLAK